VAHLPDGPARVGIFGLGLIGGSLALAVRRAWPRALIAGVDIQEQVLREAVGRGLLDAPSTDPASLAGVDLVVFAAPVFANIEALRAVAAVADQAGGAVLLTDVGSTKRAIVAAAQSCGCGRTFVGGHPLAGAATGGLADASADLFAGRKWLLTPCAETPGDLVGRLSRFVAALGAIPETITADEHDRVMALVSHLPQLVASALMHVAGEMAGGGGLEFAGRGLADTTRLASSPAGIWRDICATNADNLAPALAEMIRALQGIHDDLPRGEWLERLFTSARTWRARVP
jgi:prephenate dehydrogenase